MNYDFGTSSPEDFELLVADLLSAQFGELLETFKPGKDGGVDLRNSRVLAGESRAIVQCKRYAPHNFDQLHRALKKELAALTKLRPSRYIVATSVPLSPSNKQALLNTLRPWCHGPQDIYGAAELNALLRQFPHIERRHFKLWIASTAVLERVLHARIFNLTEATIEAAQAQLSRLVVHDGMQRALDVLRDLHHVLIVGNPGIGKTTLARMLLCHYFAEGFEPIVIAGDISEVWDIVQARNQAQRKFVVLYDDFLGQLAFDSMRFGKNEELSLGQFLHKVQRSAELRFILTTREYILADARRVHGAFDAQAKHLAKCTVSLDDYTPAHRAKVLFNHLYFSDLPNTRLQKLVERRVYRTIIGHKHFSPRIIEGISNFANSRAMSDEDYLTYIEAEFDDPSQVWDHPFRRQISSAGRELLILLWSFGSYAPLDDLRTAYALLNSEVPATERSQLWIDALRSLDGNFLTTRRYAMHKAPNEHITLAEFQNPSVRQYVEGFVKSEPAWIERLAETCVSFLQVSNLVELATPVRRNLPVAFWIKLDAAAHRLEDAPDGILVTGIDYGEFVQLWDQRVPYNPNPRLLTRLRIGASLPHHLTAALQGRLTQPVQWERLLQYMGSDSVVHDLGNLMAWVFRESDWAASIKDEINTAFHRGLGDFFPLDEYALDSQEIEWLHELAEITHQFGSGLSPAEKKMFAKAIRTAVSALLESVLSDEQLSSTVENVRQVGNLCGVSFRVQIDKILQHQLHCAKVLREEELEFNVDREDDEPRRYVAKKEPQIDIDALFSGLTDR